MSTSILDLPNELIDLILKAVDCHDILATLLTCKTLYRVDKSLLYRNVAFAQSDKRRARSFLVKLLRKPQLAGLIQNITIGGCGYRNKTNAPNPFTPDNKIIHLVGRVIARSNLLSFCLFSEWIHQLVEVSSFQAIMALIVTLATDVRSVTLDFTMRNVYNGIRTPPGLPNVIGVLGAFRSRYPRTIGLARPFHKLKELNISNSRGWRDPVTLNILPSLETLALCCYRIEQFFLKPSAIQPTAKLTTLKLHSCKIESKILCNILSMDCMSTLHTLEITDRKSHDVYGSYWAYNNGLPGMSPYQHMHLLSTILQYQPLLERLHLGTSCTRTLFSDRFTTLPKLKDLQIGFPNDHDEDTRKYPELIVTPIFESLHLSTVPKKYLEYLSSTEGSEALTSMVANSYLKHFQLDNPLEDTQDWPCSLEQLGELQRLSMRLGEMGCLFKVTGWVGPDQKRLFAKLKREGLLSL
ncbi:hypothetical protein K504DRAFT_515569 [Pleomassaria siparia CBS 279.74]|uniref:F-box domain-containing protein n=1 Tax=Pleomassaria siparia CBS 279.74 TaxID=1314801 RepID=A0A6G1JWN6_9PLEO|nr:hypothetical protein K504DRAFT_515569 [Pleomassaria siparia CBS 279.74]